MDSKSKRVRDRSGVSLASFANAKSQKYSKIHKVEKQRKLNAKKVNEYKKLLREMKDAGETQEPISGVYDAGADEGPPRKKAKGRPAPAPPVPEEGADSGGDEGPEIDDGPSGGGGGVGGLSDSDGDGSVEEADLQGRPGAGKPQGRQAGKAGGKAEESCRFWKRGLCTKGDQCRFPHPGAAAPRGEGASAGGKPVCKFFLRGGCTRGDACQFAHEGTGRTVESASMKRRNAKKAAQVGGLGALKKLQEERAEERERAQAEAAARAEQRAQREKERHKRGKEMRRTNKRGQPLMRGRIAGILDRLQAQGQG